MTQSATKQNSKLQKAMDDYRAAHKRFARAEDERARTQKLLKSLLNEAGQYLQEQERIISILENTSFNLRAT